VDAGGSELARKVSLDSVAALLKRPGFWFIVISIALITVPHYSETIRHPGFLANIFEELGLQRHAFERILYLAPIIWSGFIFGPRGILLTSLVVLACMLPRAIFISDQPTDAIFETAGVFVLGNVVAFSFRALKAERDRRNELEMAERKLQRQLEVIRQNEKRLAALNQTAAMLSQSLELQDVLEKATENVTNVMEVEIALIYLLDEGKELVLSAHRGVSAEFAKGNYRVRLGEGVSGRVAEKGEAVLVAEVSEESSVSRLANEEGVRSLLVVPMKSKGNVVGTLSVAVRSRRDFVQEEVDLLTAIANQIGVSIENARLYEKERLAMQRLAMSEKNYRGLFENANDAIWVHDLQGNYVVANRASEKVTGYSVDDLMKLNVKDFLNEESLALAREVRRKLLGGQPLEQPYEQHIIRRDGSEGYLKLTTSLVVEDGKPVGFQNMARDVTEEKRMRENLNLYLTQVTRAQEEERKRIARELHDDTIQALVVLSRQLEDTASSKSLPEDKRLLLEGLRQQTKAIMDGVRRLTQDLRPSTLDRLGLLPAIEWLGADVARYSGIDIKMNVLGESRRLPQDVELMLFRIVQEALRNVWKHSQATAAQVSINFHDGRVSIVVSDNGKGFAVPTTVGDLTRDGKLGLTGMQERARLLGGVVRLESDPGRGTTVAVEVPV
jgi:PAS domain S-box-containing protein